MPSLFELPDPFAAMRRQMMPRSPFAALRGGSAALEDDDYQFAPQERESQIRSLGRKTVGGIGAVANLIDLPGSMIRDTLGLIGSGGNWKKYNPLDQLLSPFSPDNRVYGRGLLEDAGVLAKNRPGFDAGDVAGFVVDLLTDPLSWLSGGISGAATKFGRLASKAGVINDITRLGRATIGKDAGKRFIQRTLTGADVMAKPEIAAKITPVADRLVTQGKLSPLWQSELATEPVRTAFGVQVPFTNITLGNIGRGAPGSSTFSQGVNKVLGTLGMNTAQRTPLDVIGETLRWSTPGIHAASLFSAANKQTKTKPVQLAAQKLTQAQAAGEHAVRGESLEFTQHLFELGAFKTPQAAEEASWKIRSILENAPDAPAIIAANPELGDIAGMMRAGYHENIVRKLESGLDSPPFEDIPGVGFASRSVDPAYAETKGMGRKIWGAKSPTDKAREQIFKGVRGENELGATQYLNEKVIKDSIINNEILRMESLGMTRNQIRRDVAKLIETRHGAVIERTFQVTGKGGNTVNRNRYRQLANWLVENPKMRNPKGKGLYTGHVVADFNRNVTNGTAAISIADAVAEIVAENALPRGMIGDGPFVHEVIEKLGGFNTTFSGPRVVNGQTVNVSTIFDVIRNKAGSGTAIQWQNAVLPKDIAEDLMRLRPSAAKDESAAYFGNLWNSYNSLWKASVLTRPARYFRDQFSGIAANIQEGMFTPSSPFIARRVLFGKTSDSTMTLKPVQERLAAKLATATPATRSRYTLTPENATRELRIMYAQYGPGIHNIATETVGRTRGGMMESMEDLLATMPRPTEAKLGELSVARELAATALGRNKGASWNPLKVRGVGGAEETLFPLVKAGETMGRYTDDMNRMQPWIALMQKGWDPEAAMRRVNLVQVNYDPRTFTPTERTLKRLFPFYTFTSRMMGYTAKTLAQRPGGPMGQTIKTLNTMRSDDPLLPEYVANTAAIPLGQTPEGSKRYLTGASLMWEDPMQFLGGGLGGGVLEGLSRMAPIPKYLAELGTGQSFFQRGVYGGRSLDDLNPPMGQTLANIQEMATGVKPPRTKPVLGDWFEQIVGTLFPGGSTISTAARKATEPERGIVEKAINLGTGFQTSLIRPAAQDAILDELIRNKQRKLGGRSFTKMFIPEEVRATFDPEERLAAAQITALAEELAARKKERKKQRMAMAT